MNRFTKLVLFTVAAATIASIVVWQATGGDWYTKYEVVEQVKFNPDPNDPLAAAGFYEGDATTETITRDEVRIGLLPTPSGLFDKHSVSVVSVAIPFWAFGFGIIWYRKRFTNRAASD